MIARFARGFDAIVSDNRALWSTMVLRLADLGAFFGRMAVAAAILGIDLTTPQLVLLALVALAASLVPLGRLGFREFFVAQTARWLSMSGGDVEANMDQLALVESAGELLVFVPLGVMLLPWFRRKWRGGNWARGDASVA